MIPKKNGSIVQLDDAIAWLLDMCKTKSLDSVTYKHLHESVRSVLHAEPRWLKRREHKSKACSRDLFVLALPGKVKDEYLVFLHQTVHHGNIEIEHVRNNGAHKEVWQGLG